MKCVNMSTGEVTEIKRAFSMQKARLPLPDNVTRPEICLQILLYYFIKVLMFED